MSVKPVLLTELREKERRINQTYIQIGRGFMYDFPTEKHKRINNFRKTTEIQEEHKHGA